MTEDIKYIAYDGKVFDDDDKCTEYEWCNIVVPDLFNKYIEMYFREESKRDLTGYTINNFNDDLYNCEYIVIKENIPDDSIISDYIVSRYGIWMPLKKGKYRYNIYSASISGWEEYEYVEPVKCIFN